MCTFKERATKKPYFWEIQHSLNFHSTKIDPSVSCNKKSKCWGLDGYVNILIINQDHAHRFAYSNILWCNCFLNPFQSHPWRPMSQKLGVMYLYTRSLWGLSCPLVTFECVILHDGCLRNQCLTLAVRADN